ncbi:hypothetical protein HAHE_34200 [Haloferula helveola]|uniref:Porin n=1 Tax=Haloferula helveola TaxID=490095 RepID=A0ABM7RIJ2_9BACT|nr:hypothetical protein HAHE_34200 [Haloferula helveola]
MRNYSKTVGALAAASTLVAGYASAEIEGEVHVGYHNMYEFRFVDLGDDLIEAGADIAADFGAFGLSAGAWYASYDVPQSFIGGNTKINFDELDLYAAATWSVTDAFSLELGYIYYYFPDAGSILAPLGFNLSNTQEVYLGASYDFSFGLNLSSTFYYDFDALNGWYWDNSVGYTWEFNDCLALELGAGFAFADGHGAQVSAKPGSTGTADGFQGWYLSAALPWEFREGVTLTPYVKYADADSSLSTDFYGTAGAENIVAGVTLAVGF